MSNMGIYRIWNIINSKSYIGSARDIKNRIRQHRHKLKGGQHENDYIQKSWNKYGEENFRIEVLEEVLDINDLLIREKYWIEVYESLDRDKGYNINDITEVGMKICTEETKKKISLANTGKKRSDEFKIRMSSMKRGIVISEETKKKISQSTKGRIHSEEAKNKLAESRIGKKASEETKKKMSEVRMGMKIETKKVYDFINPEGEVVSISRLNDYCKVNGLSISKMVDVFKGNRKSHKGWRSISSSGEYKRTCNEETRRKISIANTGKKRSKDFGRRISEINKGKSYNKGKKRVTRKVYKFINPAGEVEEITRLNDYCNERGLSVSHMGAVFKGTKKSYKGWRNVKNIDK